MSQHTSSQDVTVGLTTAELQLVLTGLRFLLSAEGDPVAIDRLKRLIARLEAG